MKVVDNTGQCVLKLQSIAPFDPQTEYYASIANDIKNKKIRKKYGWLIVLGGILVFLSLFTPLCPLTILGVIVCLVIIMVKRSKNKKKKALWAQSQMTNTQPQQQTIVTPINESIVEDSIFIDLNENNRIESKLSRIWRRYANSVDKQIINRKPVFSADGVKNSILFIGVNPSYNPTDDKIFVHSADDKSLMYGSLFQLPDAPAYFKALENFAEKAGFPYSHINLLYARENDRDLLLCQDHNFIREQLELTYDTILNINPKTIIFFTVYCKDLIFAHWVNPATEKSGSYILNGTNIPAFFTEDITTMDETTQFAFVQKIKFILNRR